MIHFIQDTHFDDANIIKFEGRPFGSVGQMNEILIRNWNDAIKEGDEVWVSDFMNERQENPKKRLNEILERLKGTVVLIRGNHDCMSDLDYLDAGISKVYDYPTILDGFYIVSHEPEYVNMNSPYANIFGHVHGNPSYLSVSPRSMCVSAERIGYRPISFTSAKRLIMDCKQA